MAQLTIDPQRQEMRYLCDCGRMVHVPIADLVAESVDYCGCGEIIWTLSPGDIAGYRKAAGLSELEK